jgi:hypothetical protein
VTKRKGWGAIPALFSLNPQWIGFVKKSDIAVFPEFPDWPYFQIARIVPGFRATPLKSPRIALKTPSGFLFFNFGHP